MKKQLVDVLAPIYQQYLAFCDANGVRLDFDLAEPTLAVEWSDELDNLAKALIDDALRRLRKGETLLMHCRVKIVGRGKPIWCIIVLVTVLGLWRRWICETRWRV